MIMDILLLLEEIRIFELMDITRVTTRLRNRASGMITVHTCEADMVMVK